MAEDVNKLDYLIPTGEHDIAVRELLIPIFGDAIACKIPNMACGTQTLADGGAITAAVFSTFNGGTLIFATILLIFISIFAFTKTALDGEFLGKSWNTTFTALRLIAGVGFLLPLPNGYSTIQNFGMYVALWSSGLGNEVASAVSDTYMQRLQTSMIEREPMAGAVESDLRKVLNMQMCVKFLNTQYKEAGSDLQYEKVDLSNPAFKDRAMYHYVEHGSYHPTGSSPCGRLLVEHLSDATILDDSNKEDVWGATLGANPFSRDIKKELKHYSDEMALELRKKKTEIITKQLEENSDIGNLAETLAHYYKGGIIQYDEHGNIISVPTDVIITAQNAEAFLKSYGLIVAKAQNELTQKAAELQKELHNKSQQADKNSFFYNAKMLMTSSGWMGMAATYRTMLDYSSIKFSSLTDSPYKVLPPDEKQLAAFSAHGANGVVQHIHNMNLLFDRVIDSDTGKALIAQVKQNNGVSQDPSVALSTPSISLATLEKVASDKDSKQAALDALYGIEVQNGIRNGIINNMKIGANADPLYQIKNIGDIVTAAGEFFIMSEIAVRTGLSFIDVAQAAANGSMLGRGFNLFFGTGEASKKTIEGFKYILEGLFTGVKALTFVMLSLGYLFSTWIPATPFVAFLMAQLGWLFGVVMTLFALNIWGVMHLTPARNDSFIGSEAQGYLLLVAVFFRPAIAVGALALSYIVAPPIINLVNMTLLPMMFTTNASSNTLSFIFATIFCLFLYFAIIKGVIVMIYSIPQSFPDEVMRIISAGIGDLGQSRSMSEMGAGAGAAAVAINTASRMDAAGDDHLKKVMEKHRDKMRAKADDANGKSSVADGTPSNDRQQDIAGAGDGSEEKMKSGKEGR